MVDFRETVRGSACWDCHGSCLAIVTVKWGYCILGFTWQHRQLVPYGVKKLTACKGLEAGTLFCHSYCLQNSWACFISSYYCMFFQKSQKPCRLDQGWTIIYTPVQNGLFIELTAGHRISPGNLFFQKLWNSCKLLWSNENNLRINRHT